MKKTLLASLLAATSLSSLAGDYFVVVPLPGKAAQLASINVALNNYTLPEAIAGSPYAGFDFKSVLSVTGDAAYNGSLVSWKVASGSLPAGLVLNADGTLSGTPTVVGTSNFTLKATYKTKTGQQAYQVVSLGITVSLAAATLPEAKVTTAYSYNFKSRVSVLGDPNYSVSNVIFSATGLPEGMVMSSAGVLSGTPTTKNTSGTSFQVVASYKTKIGQQVYTIVVNGVTLDVTQISAGGSHTCAVTPLGGAKCWGWNFFGELGSGGTSTTPVKTPVSVSGLASGVASIHAGSSHTCALLTTGGVKCWGSTTYGQLGDGSAVLGSSYRATPVDAIGLTSGVSSITTKGSANCAITTTGGLKCWGLNTGVAPYQNTPADVSGVRGLTSGVVDVALGTNHTCVVTTAGAAQCWGTNSSGQVGDGTTGQRLTVVPVSGLTSGVTRITAGSNHSCALLVSGGMKCWGSNTYGQLGDNSTTNRLTPVDVLGLTAGVGSISGGGDNTCAVTSSGGAKCWGNNSSGQLGDGTTTNQSIPVDVMGLSSGVISISSGGQYACAVTTAGGAKCWGGNGNGQLGNNSTANSPVPVDVVNP